MTYWGSFRYLKGSKMFRQSRQALSLVYVVSIMVIGNRMMLDDVGNGYGFSQEVGQSIFLAPSLLCTVLVALHLLTTKDRNDLEFRVLHLAWVNSFLFPSCMLLIQLVGSEKIVWTPAIVFFLVTWATYWGCRFLIEGSIFREDLDTGDDSIH